MFLFFHNAVRQKQQNITVYDYADVVVDWSLC